MPFIANFFHVLYTTLLSYSLTNGKENQVLCEFLIETGCGSEET